ncbi:MAG: hypothetical protein Rhirs2KO_06110 [Rhizobiaceae bacterium]
MLQSALAHGFKHTEPAHARHLQIENHGAHIVDAARFERLQPRFATIRDGDGMAGFGKSGLQQAALNWIIIDNED